MDPLKKFGSRYPRISQIITKSIPTRMRIVRDYSMKRAISF